MNILVEEKPSQKRRGLIPQTLRIMKLTAILIFGFLMQVSATGFSQTVTLSERNVPLKKVFKEIKQQTGYDFLYAHEVVQRAGNVSVRVENATLKEALDEVLQGKNLVYKIMENTVLIKVASKKALSLTPDFALEFLQIDVSGKVTDEDGKPLVGVSVAVKGTSKGASTNAKGEYVLNNVDENAILVFTGVNIVPYEVKVKGREKLGTIILKQKTSQGDEIVINTGIFTRPKENFTGASSSYTGEDLARVSNTNLLNAISALDPSFHIAENINIGSDPNKIPDIVIRGGNSLVDPGVSGSANPFNYLNNPNTPLFILDGFETSLQRINDLDMNRVSNVVILKDAAATAIYGSRAANGVLVIETVRPKSGNLRIIYTGNLSVETPDLQGYNLLNASEKLELEKNAGVYDFSWNSRDQELAYFYNARKAAVESGVNTDWLAQPVRNAVGMKHNLYLEGGEGAVQYGINLSYNQDNGVMKGSQRQTISGNSMLSYRIKNFQFRNELTLNFNKGVNSPYGSFTQYARLNPYWAPYDSEGNLKYYLEDVYANEGNRLNNFDRYDNLDGQGPSRPINPMYNTQLHTIDRTAYNNLVNNFSIQWQINNWLKINSRLAYQRQSDQSDNFFPAQATQFASTPTFEKGAYTKGIGERRAIEELLTADVNKRFGKSQIFATVGTNLREEKFDFYSFTVQGFPNASLDQLTLGNKFPDNSKPVGSESISRLFSLLSNVSYSYDSRYLLDLSYRLDGSSQFGSEKRFAPLWSVGAGWNLHNEAFLKNSRAINRMKLRYSFGYTGSQNFPAYLGITTTQYYTDREYRGIISSYLLGYGNANLGWQKTQKNNVGADITLFNKLDITANYFIEKTKGSIASISTAPSTGFNNYSANLGDLQSKGWELNTRYTIFSNRSNRNIWSVFLNATSVHTIITKVSREIEEMNKKADTSYSSTPFIRYAEGQSTSAIWAVRSLGIDPSTGQEIFLSKDGKLVSTYNPLDKVIVGDMRPKIEGTFGTNFEWKGIGLNVYFRFKYGGKTFNQTLIDRVENIDVSLYNVDRRVGEQRWLKPGDHTFFKGLVGANGGTITTPTYASSRFVQDDNLLSLESASVYYRFSDNLNKKLHLQNSKFTIYTSNLMRFSSIARERGLNYPFSHQYTLQFTTTF